MSELTVCNYCNLEVYKEEARKKGHNIVLKSSNFLNGTDVFSVPKGEELPEGMVEPCEEHPNGNEAHRKYHIGWMWTIPDRCHC